MGVKPGKSCVCVHMLTCEVQIPTSLAEVRPLLPSPALSSKMVLFPSCCSRAECFLSFSKTSSPSPVLATLELKHDCHEVVTRSSWGVFV